MIERLLETTQAPGGAPRIDQRIRDCLGERRFADMMRTGKRREQTIARQQLERAHVQLAIPAHGIVETALGFRERWRIEHDEVVLGLGLLRRAEELKNVLLNPLHLQTVPLRVRARSREAIGAYLYASHVGCTGARAGQRERSLARETIEHAAAF